MNLRKPSAGWVCLTIALVALLAVGVACAGDKVTPTSPPVATATLAPTATSVPPTATLVPTATATLMPGETPAVPTATATAVPQPTPTEVNLTWIERYMQSPGYQPEWGKPQTGGIVKQRMARNPNDFTPNVGQTTNGNFNVPIYNPLLRFDPWVGTESITPDLAKSWQWSDDFLHLTMKLEEGVKFQDNPNIPERLRNADFTCEDVQASVERHVRPPEWEKKMNLGPSQLGHLNGVSCPDGPLGYMAVLSFDLLRANTMASLAQGVMVMLDKEYIEWLNTEHPGGLATVTPQSHLWGTGSGPFIPHEYVPDVVVKLRRNPTYFREGLPLVDGMDLHVLKDYTTAFTALATGQINYFGHGSWAMLPGQVAQAERDFKDRIVVHVSAHTNGYGMQFNLSREPFNDVRVRKAIHLAIDRDDWLAFRKAGSFNGSTLMGQLVPKTYYSYTEAELRTWPGIRQPKDADIAEANRLLDEVFGAGKRFKTSCDSTNTQDYLDVCLFIVDQLKRSLNVDVVMNPAEPAVDSQRTESGNFNMKGSSTARTQIGDPDDYLLKEVHTGYPKTPSEAFLVRAAKEAEPVLWAELEALMDAESIEMDIVKRKEIVQEIDWMLAQEIIYKVQFGMNNSMPGTSPNLKGFTLPPFAVYWGWTLWERVWLAN